MSSINWPSVETAPQLLVLPAAAASLDEAEAAIELWEHYTGKTLLPDQRLTVCVMMAQDASGRWAASTTGREKTRQQGKGEEVEVVELWGLVQRAEAILHTVHDAVLLATQTQQRLLSVLEGHSDLRRRVKRRWLGTGQQMIEMRNGGIVWYRTRTAGGGRGVDDVARVVVDEAQHATGEQMAAAAPTMAANPDPQMNVLGTAGLRGKSGWWWKQRIRALSDDPGRFGYVGHTAERVELVEGVVVQHEPDVEDRELWRLANPASAAGFGGGMGFLEEQYRRLGPERFAEEHLGVWAPPPDDATAGGDRPISEQHWIAAGLDPSSSIAGRVVFGVDTGFDLERASISAAGRRTDALAHVELVEAAAGIGWVGERVGELLEAWDVAAVAVDASGPAKALVPALERVCDAAGVPLVKLSAGAYQAGCRSFVAAVAEGDVRHLSDQLLTEVALAATKRRVGDGWVWERRNSDVSPLAAVTVAHAALAGRDTTAQTRSVYEDRGLMFL